MTNNNNSNKSKKKKKFLSIILIVIGFLLFSSISAVISVMLIYKDSIHSGIYIENVDIGGLTVVEANEKVEESLKNVLSNEKVILKYKDNSWKLNSEDIGMKYDFLKAVNDAYLIGRRGNFFDRINTMVDLLKEPHNVSLKTSIDMKKVNEILNVIEKDINRPSVDATIKRENEQFIISKETIGIRLNKEKTAEKISSALLNSNFYDIAKIDIEVETVTPKYTSDMLSRIQHPLGSYTTKFNLRSRGRSYNVKLASDSINAKVFLPGEIFSFNDVVGPRDVKNGYKNAPVIFKGELVDGIGGGVCQVSSTLYNTVLYSQLGIIERTNHSIPSTYVPIGLDATVSYGVLDFKFQNTTDAPIYIESIINKNRITVNIFGEKNSNKEVKLTSRIDKVIKRDTEIVFDENMFLNEEVIEDKGRDGYRVSSYIHIYEDGKLIDKKLISKDYYRPRKQIKKKGTKKPVEESNDVEDDQEQLQEKLDTNIL